MVFAKLMKGSLDTMNATLQFTTYVLRDSRE